MKIFGNPTFTLPRKINYTISNSSTGSSLSATLPRIVENWRHEQDMNNVGYQNGAFRTSAYQVTNTFSNDPNTAYKVYHTQPPPPPPEAPVIQDGPHPECACTASSLPIRQSIKTSPYEVKTANHVNFNVTNPCSTCNKYIVMPDNGKAPLTNNVIHASSSSSYSSSPAFTRTKKQLNDEHRVKLKNGVTREKNNDIFVRENLPASPTRKTSKAGIDNGVRNNSVTNGCIVERAVGAVGVEQNKVSRLNGNGEVLAEKTTSVFPTKQTPKNTTTVPHYYFVGG